MKTLSQATDTQLVRAFQDGNNKALEVLVDEMTGPILQGVRHIMLDAVLRENHSLLPKRSNVNSNL